MLCCLISCVHPKCFEVAAHLRLIGLPTTRFGVVAHLSQQDRRIETYATNRSTHVLDRRDKIHLRHYFFLALCGSVMIEELSIVESQYLTSEANKHQRPSRS